MGELAERCPMTNPDRSSPRPLPGLFPATARVTCKTRESVVYVARTTLLPDHLQAADETSPLPPASATTMTETIEDHQDGRPARTIVKATRARPLPQMLGDPRIEGPRACPLNDEHMSRW